MDFFRFEYDTKKMKMGERFFLNMVLNVLYVLIVIFLIIRRDKLGKHIWYFITAIIIVVFTEILVSILPIFFNRDFSPNPFYVVGILVFYFMLVLIYFYKILNNKYLKRIQIGIIILNLLNLILSFIFIDNILEVFPAITNFITVMLLLFSISLFFYETFNSEIILNITDYYPFWISISLIVINLGLMPLIYVSTKYEKLPISRDVFIYLLFFVNLVGYSLMFVGIFFSKKINFK